ncbi:GDSL-type esterase/lipase family protein (plasmid) [Pseudoalteromonas sp. T1lg65]|uniref:SGNH/GDSL hydrolase family protein n=1 Tax=Pseudoalteromonas sp. T1lg65 TaxID=2077101 RepID=UPI003F7A5829
MRLPLFLMLLVATELSAQQLPATDHNIIFEGRVSKNYQQGSVKLNWPGTQMRTKLIGRSIAIDIKGYGDQFDVLVDGKLHKKLKTSYSGESEHFVLFEQEDHKAVNIELVKRWENYQNNTEILQVHIDGRVEGIWQQQPHILFIGDSISAGFGSESNKRQCEWPEVVATSNARLAFPYMTADMLNASYTQVSYSGLGLVRNWSGNQPHHTLRSYYDQFSAVPNSGNEFIDKYPQLIVIEVGTNDFSTDPQPHEPWDNILQVKASWENTMVEFVTTLRNRYPMTPIIFMPRPAYPYDYIIPATETAKSRLEKLGVTELYTHNFYSELNGCVWHPTESEHKSIADNLAGFIRSISIL